MRLSGPPGVASNPEPAGGHRAGAGVVRTLSVTAMAVAACAMFALPAGAATKHASTVTASASPKTAYTEAPVKLSATVKSSGKTPTGRVAFWFGTRRLCRGTLSRGKTSCTAKFADAATKKITAKYTGDTTHKMSSGTVTVTIKSIPPGMVATTTTVTTPAPTPPNAYTYVYAGDSVALRATVASNTGNSVPTGTVTFAPVEFPPPGPPPASLSCTATLAAGVATCKVTAPVDSYGFTLYEATYTPTAGSHWTTSNSTQAGIDHKLVTWDVTSTLLTFNSPATVGDPVTLKADVTDQGGDALASAFSVAPDVVTFTANGADICTNVPVTDTETAPNDPDNIATCKYTPTTAGPVTIEALYSGDDYALPSNDSNTLTVNN
jgi:hypothetical protein